MGFVGLKGKSRGDKEAIIGQAISQSVGFSDNKKKSRGLLWQGRAGEMSVQRKWQEGGLMGGWWVDGFFGGLGWGKREKRRGGDDRGQEITRGRHAHLILFFFHVEGQSG